MTEQTTNPVDGDAMPEVVDALAGENDHLDPIADNQDIEGDEPLLDDEGNPLAVDEELEEVVRGDKTYRIPKELAGELLMQSDYTRKTQEVAEIRKAVETRQEALQRTEQRQMEFAQDIANLGALNDRLAPYMKVTDWPTYLRTGGGEAQAHYAEFQALQRERDGFAQTLGQKVQQRTQDEQRETAKLVEAGRAELAKQIKGYGPDTLNGLLKFAEERLGYSSQELQDAEADPRQIRALHLAQIGQQALQAQKKTQQLAQSQRTTPVQTLRGAGGRIVARADTNDFAAFERMADERLKAPR